MHRPADRIHDGTHSIGTAGRTNNLSHLKEFLNRAPCNLRHHFWCIPIVVPLEQLEDTPWVLKRRIAADIAIGPEFVTPRGLIVGARCLFKPGEQPVLKSEIAVDQKRCVGVLGNIICMMQVLGQDVPDQPAEHRNVRPGPNLHMLISNRRSTSEPRVNSDQRGPILISRFNRPLKTTRMVLSWIGPHH